MVFLECRVHGEARSKGSGLKAANCSAQLFSSLNWHLNVREHILHHLWKGHQTIKTLNKINYRAAADPFLITGNSHLLLIVYHFIKVLSSQHLLAGSRPRQYFITVRFYKLHLDYASEIRHFNLSCYWQKNCCHLGWDTLQPRGGSKSTSKAMSSVTVNSS